MLTNIKIGLTELFYVDDTLILVSSPQSSIPKYWVLGNLGHSPRCVILLEQVPGISTN